MSGNFRLTAVLHAPICLLNRNTVAWYPVSLVFLPFWAHLIISMKRCSFSFIWKLVFFACPRVLGVTVIYQVEIPSWSTIMFDVMSGNFRLTAVWHSLITTLCACCITTLWHDAQSVWFYFLFWAHLVVSMKVCRLSFIWKVVFLPVPVFLVSQWYISSRSLVHQRWSLTWCPVIFVWLHCYMRPSACWIATLWHDTQSVWFSFHFWAH